MLISLIYPIKSPALGYVCKADRRKTAQASVITSNDSVLGANHFSKLRI